MTREELLADIDESVRAFAEQIAGGEAETTGIPRPPRIEVTESQIKPEVIDFDLERKPTTAEAGEGGGGGGGGPPPHEPGYELSITGVTVQGSCYETDCIAYGGSTNFFKSVPNSTGGSLNVSLGLADVFNPCVGLSDQGCGFLDWKSFSAAINVVLGQHGIVAANGFVDSDLESGFTVCFGNCSDPDSGWCGWVTCWIVGYAETQQTGNWGVYWNSFADAVAHGPYIVNINLDMIAYDDVYCGGCGDADDNKCWPDLVQNGATFGASIQLNATMTMHQI